MGKVFNWKRFTGWVDVDLTEQGKAEGKKEEY